MLAIGRSCLCITWLFWLLTGASHVLAQTTSTARFDVVIYGGTSGGITAAIQTRLMGKTVVLIEPSRHLGGLSAGGLGATDIGNKAAIGGLAREFYRRIGQHYQQPQAWKWQRREEYRSSRQQSGELEMWTFEPHVAEGVFTRWLQEHQVPVVLGERLDWQRGVRKQGTKIVAITMESGRTFSGSMFIDATYEGDLMAKAGVPYHIGREANSVYGETLNGVQTARAIHHQFIKLVDPFVIPGDRTSGLLPLVQAEPPGEEGQGDHRVQAYCFRLCTTDVPENRRPWPKPEGYDERTYELLLRNFEAGDHRIPWNPVWMPNRKTDTNNNYAVSTDYIGANYDYPDGDYATRDKIIEQHKRYQMGLMYTLANHPRVPEKVRAEFQRLGLARDEFVDNDNWPHQLYVREARRMISEYVMNQNHCQQRIIPEDPVGLGAYNMDSHHVQRYVTPEGYVRNEGDIQVGVSPYKISYRSIRPRKEHVENLLVPVCLSASHIAYGSIRMEPVFMVLGQSAATAACLSLEQGCAVQDLPYPLLRDRLLADRQVLEWTGPSVKPPRHHDPLRLPGVVVDDTQAMLAGEWHPSSALGGFVGDGYRHDNNANKAACSAVYKLRVPRPGTWELRLYYTASANRASNVPVLVEIGDLRFSLKVNQRQSPRDDYVTLKVLTLQADDVVVVTITNADTDGHVIIDAVQLAPLDP
ncbi:MAG: xanthan lyase [Planctomycetaceae bacterium]|nr:MAG: xanthan lyase [Planctomycetaceae bacterium]